MRRSKCGLKNFENFFFAQNVSSSLLIQEIKLNRVFIFFEFVTMETDLWLFQVVIGI